MFKRTLSMVATAGLVGGMIALAVPAQAGTKWSSPQQVSTKFGRDVQLSDNGKVAVWIRSNRLLGDVTGPVRSAYYVSKKKGWTKSVSVPGSTETTNLMLSSDGTYAFLENGETGYSLAKRTSTNNWATAQSLVTGVRLRSGQMSANANTVVWADFVDSWMGPGAEPPGDLKAIVRAADGTWSAPVLLGKVSTEGAYSYQQPVVALSRDGSTVVWLDENSALNSAVKAADGSWVAGGIVKQYAGYVGLEQVGLSANGSSVMWIRGSVDGILTSTRTSTGWTAAMNATVDETDTAALSPDGEYMFWATGDGDIQMSMRLSDRWATAKTVGTVFYGYSAQLALTNKTVAYGSIGYKNGKPTCAVSTSLLKGGSWTKGKKLASSVCHPAVAYKGKTIVWGAFKTKTLQSVKR
jgi:hypothetical protein